MPLHALKVPAGPNQFFAAFSLGLLLPVLYDNRRLDETLYRLFGHIAGSVVINFVGELKTYTATSFPTSLTGLIDSNLRPKLVDYILAHKEEYREFFDSEASLLAGIEAVRSGERFFGELEEKATELMTATRLVKHETDAVLSSSVLDESTAVHLMVDDNYQLLLNPERLAESLRHQLFPTLLTPSTGIVAIDPNVLRRAELKRILKATLLVIPPQLAALSTIMPKPNRDADPFRSSDPTDLLYNLRSDAFRESTVVAHSELVRVPLTRSYDLCMMSSSDTSLDKYRLYITFEAEGFNYSVLNTANLVVNGSIAFAELGSELRAPVRLEQLRPLLSTILDITGRRGHTQIEPAAIGDLSSWGRSLGKSALVSSTAGLTTVGFVTLVGEGIAAGAGVAAIPVVGVPIAAVTLLVVLGAAVFGKQFAVKYEKVLNTVRGQLSEGNFEAAARALDMEFGRYNVTKALRSLFLTNQHHALAHFFRGMCAEGMGYFPTAFTEYQKACQSAEKVGKSLTVFISKLQLLKLLKEKELPGITKETEIDKLLWDLNKSYPESLAKFYWKIQEVMSTMATRFAVMDALSERERYFANAFLKADGFFLVKHFSDDRGLFVEIFGAFFQGIILAYFDHTNPIYLERRVKDELIAALFSDSRREYTLTELAAKKFSECANLLRTFKTTHADLISHHPQIVSGIKLIETFMIYYHVLSLTHLGLTIDDIPRLLPVDRSRVLLLSSEVDATIDFMAKLQQDFGVPFETAEAWLDALLKTPSPEANLVSSKTGDTMLHALARLPKTQSVDLSVRAKEAAERLKHYRYVRNHKDETALVLLSTSDPYDLKLVIDSEPYVKFGNALEQMERFVRVIQTNPSVEEHFLLLEGLPGTGKTSAVTTHLKQLGFLVETIEHGADAVERTACFTVAAQRPVPEGKVRVIFIDNLEKVLSDKVPTENLSRTLAEIDVFVRRMIHLDNKHVVLIGATRTPGLLSELITLKAGANRVSFELPDANQRLQLLTHFFRKKRIATSAIEALAIVANGYSPGQLHNFVESLVELTVASDLLKSRFNYYARRLGQNFHGTTSCLRFTMPSFETASDLAGLSLPNKVLEIQLAKLKGRVSTSPTLPHILLKGPSDSGKKTAIRLLAEQSGRALVTLNYDPDITTPLIRAIFAMVKELGRAVIFIDRMELYVLNPAIALCLQREIASLRGSDVIVVGIVPIDIRPKDTNSGLLECFSSVNLITLGSRERGQGIRKLLIESENAYPGKLYFDEELREALDGDVTSLGEATQGLASRKAQAAMRQLIGELIERLTLKGSGIIYLRLQDVQTYMGCLIRQADSGSIVLYDYIDATASSLFQAEIPAVSCKLILSSCVPTLEILRATPMHSNTAYVRVSNGTVNQLFFIDATECIELRIAAAKLAEFDIGMKPTTQAKALSNQQRAAITLTTGHSLIKTVFSLDILEILRRDFSLHFDSVNAWLTALLAPDSTLAGSVSREGDTMLHVLVKVISADEAVIAKIKESAARLIQLRYARNHRHETPLLALELADPYRMKDILRKEVLIKIGDNLDRVEDFLKRIVTHPEIDSHFLLLDGPPGTGKTSSVVSHLKTSGYAVTEWVRGTEADKLVGGLLTRIGRFFEDAKKRAQAGVPQVLFIDEIDAVIPKVSGTTLDGYHNKSEDVTAFQMAITSLAGHRVVLIGATNYPERLPEPILGRAGTNRIYFPLPDVHQRQALLQHLFMGKEINPSCIERLAAVTISYSPRELCSFVETIKEKRITSELMIAYLNAYALRLRRDFKAEFGCAELFMPSFEEEGEIGKLFSFNPELSEQLRRLQCQTAADPLMHTLLYGPPGGGKTTAVRVFAQKSGQVLLSVQATERTSAEVLTKLFSRAKQFGRAIIFFDEMDQVAQRGSPHTAFLQTEMDGMTTNGLTIIGATNYPERFEEATLSRFTSKLLLSPLTEAQLSKPIKTSLLEGALKYGAPLYFDAELAAELEDGATRLGHESTGLSLRWMNATLAYLIGDLSRERGSHVGITYLRFQDVCFAFYRMKIQEGLVKKPVEGLPTTTAYIHTHKYSFFQMEPPPGSVAVPSSPVAGSGGKP